MNPEAGHNPEASSFTVESALPARFENPQHAREIFSALSNELEQ